MKDPDTRKPQQWGYQQLPGEASRGKVRLCWKSPFEAVRNLPTEVLSFLPRWSKPASLSLLNRRQELWAPGSAEARSRVQTRSSRSAHTDPPSSAPLPSCHRTTEAGASLGAGLPSACVGLMLEVPGFGVRWLWLPSWLCGSLLLTFQLNLSNARLKLRVRGFTSQGCCEDQVQVLRQRPWQKTWPFLKATSWFLVDCIEMSSVLLPAIVLSDSLRFSPTDNMQSNREGFFKLPYSCAGPYLKC